MMSNSLRRQKILGLNNSRQSNQNSGYNANNNSGSRPSSSKLKIASNQGFLNFSTQNHNMQDKGYDLKNKLNNLANTGLQDSLNRQAQQGRYDTVVDYDLKTQTQNMQSNDFIGSGRKFGAPKQHVQVPIQSQTIDAINNSQMQTEIKNALRKQQQIENAKKAAQRFQNDLLDKFRTNKRPNLLSSNPLEQLKIDEKKMVNLTKSPDQLVLDVDDEDDELVFQDQVQIRQNKPVEKVSEIFHSEGHINKKQIQKKAQDEIMQIESDDELEILSEHLRDETDDIQKQGIFEYINGAKPQKSSNIDFKSRQQGSNLNYGGVTNAIQKSYRDKYFPEQQQQMASSLGSMAKQNTFLNKKSSGIRPSDIPVPVKNPTSNIKKSSLCQNKPLPPKVHYGSNPYDFAKHASDRNFEEASAMIKAKHESKLLLDSKKKEAEKIKLLKQRELIRKKRALENKQKQDEVIDDLFDYGLSKQKKNEKEEKARDGLQALRDSSSSESSSSDSKGASPNEQIEIPDTTEAERQLAHHHRQMQIREIHEQRQRDELNEKLRKGRYDNRYNVDELVQPILNLDLITNFASEGEFCPKNRQFPTVPIQFQSSAEYFEVWLELFLYETYNQLINQRNESDKDKEISQMYGMKSKNDNSQKNFQGFLQRSKQDQKFIYLKLSEKKSDDDEKNDTTKKRYNFAHLSSLKEFDLLLLSKEELDVKNVKKLTSAQFLKDIQNQPGKMMAMVNQKRQQDKTFLELKVDICHDKQVNLNISEYDYYEMYVYYFDSMSTRIREFRTVKSAEFYPASQFILNPQLIPKREPEVAQGGSLLANAMRPPTDRLPGVMKHFVQKHSLKFNSSQNQALNDVATMKPVDFMLIQGPPGTGKTHTIKGIISMLNHALGRSKKILVCAPSNAAIDEIVTRLISKGGLFGQSESESIKKVLRIGSFDYEPSEIVKQVLFDTKFQDSSSLLESQEEQEKAESQKKRWQEDIIIVDKIISILESKTKKFSEEEIKKLASELLADKGQIDAFMKYDTPKKIKKVQSYKETVKKNLADQDRVKNSPNKNMSKVQRKAVEKKIVEQTQIICTTLAMSTNEKLECLKPGDIEFLIVDEACQSVELNNLIPFEHQPNRVILVGDQQQLPATTFSENAEQTNYSRSMFERFLKCGIDKAMLEIQYRMDPVIREFPSSQFYENRLQDAESIVSRLDTPDFKAGPIAKINSCINPVMFFDLLYSSENESEKSKINNDEVFFIEKLIMKLVIIVAQKTQDNFNKSRDVGRFQKNTAMKSLKGSIGIISPYKSQVRLLKEKLFKFVRHNFEIDRPQEFLEINTVDAFQGREKDIIIFSSVRSNKDQGLGFVSDYRRMNVAITRAKHCLYIVGNSQTLNRDKNWRDLISYTRSKRSFKDFRSKDDQFMPERAMNKPQQKPISPKHKPRQISPKNQIKKPPAKRDSSNTAVGLSGLEELLSGKNDKEMKGQEPESMDSKRKLSEEGQILSSGQLADKQATEAEDTPEIQSRTEKTKLNSSDITNCKEEGQLSNSDAQSSNYQSYSSSKYYGKKNYNLKENQPYSSERKDKSSERYNKSNYQNKNYRKSNHHQKHQNYDSHNQKYQNQNNDQGFKNHQTYHNEKIYNNDWVSSSIHSRGDHDQSSHRHQAQSQQRYNNRPVGPPQQHYERSQSRHSDWNKKREMKAQYKNNNRQPTDQQYYDNNRQYQNGQNGYQHQHYAGKRPRY